MLLIHKNQSLISHLQKNLTQKFSSTSFPQFKQSLKFLILMCLIDYPIKSFFCKPGLKFNQSQSFSFASSWLPPFLSPGHSWPRHHSPRSPPSSESPCLPSHPAREVFLDLLFSLNKNPKHTLLKRQNEPVSN